MNIFKLLLIEAVLIIGTIAVLFYPKGIKKFYVFKTNRENGLFREISLKLTDKEKLFELETLTKTQGSGIQFDSPTGDWKFVSVWKKDNDIEDLFFSSLLRIFSANIEFKKDNSVEHSTKFLVISSIQFGIFTIEF